MSRNTKNHAKTVRREVEANRAYRKEQARRLRASNIQAGKATRRPVGWLYDQFAWYWVSTPLLVPHDHDRMVTRGQSWAKHANKLKLKAGEARTLAREAVESCRGQ